LSGDISEFAQGIGVEVGGGVIVGKLVGVEVGVADGSGVLVGIVVEVGVAVKVGSGGSVRVRDGVAVVFAVQAVPAMITRSRIRHRLLV
jgi:hypothetical protein